MGASGNISPHTHPARQKSCGPGTRSKCRRLRVNSTPPLLVTIPAIKLSAMPIELPDDSRVFRISLALSAANSSRGNVRKPASKLRMRSSCLSFFAPDRSSNRMIAVVSSVPRRISRSTVSASPLPARKSIKTSVSAIVTASPTVSVVCGQQARPLPFRRAILSWRGLPQRFGPDSPVPSSRDPVHPTRRLRALFPRAQPRVQGSAHDVPASSQW